MMKISLMISYDIIWYHDIPTLIILYIWLYLLTDDWDFFLPIGRLVWNDHPEGIPYMDHQIGGCGRFHRCFVFSWILSIQILWQPILTHKIGWSRFFHIFPYHLESIILNHTHIVSLLWMIDRKQTWPTKQFFWLIWQAEVPHVPLVGWLREASPHENTAKRWYWKIYPLVNNIAIENGHL